MKIIRTRIRDSEYFNSEVKKDTIILHHTVSKVGKYVKDWFEYDNGKVKVATTYVVDKDGTIRELFNPYYWAYHTGTNNRDNIDKRSIGIEIVNEGGLKRKKDKYTWGDHKATYDGEVFTAEKKWRDFEYFAKYTPEQVKAVGELLEYLLARFDIKRECVANLDYDEKYFTSCGVIAHSNIRKDKTDISLAYPLDKVIATVEGFKMFDWRRIEKSMEFVKIDVPEKLEEVTYDSPDVENTDNSDNLSELNNLD